MEAALADALARDPDDPRILGDLHGRVLATRAFVADDLGALRDHLDAMMAHVDGRRRPARRSSPGAALWATLHTIDDDDLGAAAAGRAAERGRARWAWPSFDAAADVVEAVGAGPARATRRPRRR